MNARTLAAATLIAALGTAIAQPNKPAEPVNAPVPVALQPKVAEKPDLPKLLATRVSVQKFDGKFKDAVKMLSEAYDLPLIVDPRLQDPDAGMACDNAIDDKPVKLPKLANVRLDTVVTLLAEQVNGKFLVYPDHVKIVPTGVWLYETAVLQHDPQALANGTDDTPLLPLQELLKAKPLTKRGVVNASFKNKPLAEVIDEIAEATGANVAVSPLLPANVRQAPVTVKFANAPVDAAVRMLAEMTESGVIEDANTLLITTRERAAARAKEEAQKAKDRQPPPQAFGPLAFPNTPLPDVNGELLKLKEQNEQLKKELEELKKSLKK